MVDLEERCGDKLSVADASFAWLVQHACDIMNRFKLRTGDKTAWEVLKGLPFTGERSTIGGHRSCIVPPAPSKGGVCSR